MQIPNHFWRWAGGLTLGGAALMLLLGTTMLQNRLAPTPFVLWWTVCLLLTLVAMLCALFDLRRIRVQSRAQHRDLVAKTFGSIEQESLRRKTNGDSRPTRRPGE